MKLIIWEGAGKKIIHVSCDVDDEEVMLEVVLQDLKGSLVSNVESNIIYLRNGKKMCMSLRVCYIGPEKDYMGDWDTYKRLSCDLCWTQDASLETRVTSRDVDNAEWGLESCTTC
jgi:hypothetical protein